MKSKIYHGTVMHSRHGPIERLFKYPFYFYAFDLAELPLLDQRCPLFGYNRRRLVSIHDADYLEEGPGTIREKLLRQLADLVDCRRIERIVLVTAARYFNYVFNPVSFYYCYDSNNQAFCHVAEVNNTFHERQLYLLTEAEAPKGVLRRYVQPKALHVSPFNDMRGDYEFLFTELEEKLEIWVNILRADRTAFHARLDGVGCPFSTKNLMTTIMKYPITAALTMPRIAWQAAQLNYREKLKVYPKPPPLSPLSIRRAKATRWERGARRLVFRVFQRCRVGRLRVILPEGGEHFFGDAQGELVTLRLHHHKFFTAILAGGDVAFGETFTDGIWDSPDPTALLEFFIHNRENLAKRPWLFSRLSTMGDLLKHIFQPNSITGSRRNIQRHYDLSNQLFESFLDSSMMYSSAIFANPEMSLDEAQAAKLQAIIRKARLQPGDHVLEIGSGWGAFALAAVRHSGCRVTAITLSPEQCRYMREKVAAAGLNEQIRVELCDYRRVTGQYDKIISIEMIEAVGHKYLPSYFAALERLLKPQGLVLLQAITIPDQRYRSYLRRCDWIQKYIFPGAVLPSLSALNEAIGRNSQLLVEDLENIGPHYATTLREWRRRFNAHGEELERLGFDSQFQRLWNYYFHYCEAGFRSRTLNCLQLLLTRPGNETLRYEEQQGTPPPSSYLPGMACPPDLTTTRSKDTQDIF